MEEYYKLKVSPQCSPGNVVQGDNYRFTVLTSQLIRLEYCRENLFEDHATQVVLNRDFQKVPFQTVEKENALEIITKNLHLRYNKRPFSKNGLSIEVLDNCSDYRNIWKYSDELNDLRGTARTLDNTAGPIPLEHGLLSVYGFSVLDDSGSLLLLENGWVAPREKKEIDLYFFGYGRNFLRCLKDFYRLCGKTPMLPRYALGNWWSRYNRYSESSYRKLILRFREENTPFSVAVLDMDWHLVDVGPGNGSGWTGYTWNRKLFPDPAAFLKWLHEQGLKVCLNLHPANGVMPYEEAYGKMAEALGIKDGRKIDFDIADSKFLMAYFKFLHHPNEEIGVDFWWIDWQQGADCSMDGMDPLWMLNHYHYLDQNRRNKRPLILSRYAGAGSHRYPVGFSGDSIICWESLDFQPYFTANASNVGYGWWSHDIGGHMCGVKDDELAIRWVQFGVFSPISRLHSSSGPFNGKEPWNYNPTAEGIIKDFLRLRHRLIPYLYTMNYRFAHDDLPLIQPMYYQHPDEYDAYHAPNEYYFGSELIACPITKPADARLGVAQARVWLPEGIWIDVFTGIIYRGGRVMQSYRTLFQLPVFAKAGAVIPMAELSKNINETSNPAAMDIRVFAGADNRFTMYEDNGKDGISRHEAFTDLIFHWGRTCDFRICATKGDREVIPEKRDYTIRFCGMEDPEKIEVFQGGMKMKYEKAYAPTSHTVCISLKNCPTDANVVIRLAGAGLAHNDITDLCYRIIDRSQIEYNLKDKIYLTICNEKDISRILGILQALDIPKDLFGAICEILTA
ncbi:alpha-xylosidase [Clostridium sp. W14A]|nr:alpha-xylosidase [Clostridium sp. W14A]